MSNFENVLRQMLATPPKPRAKQKQKGSQQSCEPRGKLVQRRNSRCSVVEK